MSTNSTSRLIEWMLARVTASGVNEDCTPHIVLVTRKMLDDPMDIESISSNDESEGYSDADLE